MVIEKKITHDVLDPNDIYEEPEESPPVRGFHIPDEGVVERRRDRIFPRRHSPKSP